jgi:hypothetical protein
MIKKMKQFNFCTFRNLTSILISLISGYYAWENRNEMKALLQEIYTKKNEAILKPQKKSIYLPLRRAQKMKNKTCREYHYRDKSSGKCLDIRKEGL